MASLYIKDGETAALATEVAAMLNTTKTDAVRDALLRRRAEIKAAGPKQDLASWLRDYRRRKVLPPTPGPVADKVFYDWLSGEEDEPDV
jgi:antitoxin VapB